MDSTNHNQPEHHRENLTGDSAIHKIKSLVNTTKSCFFCTSIAVDGSTAARPMTVQKVDAEGNLWFLSARDTHKDEELKINPRVRLYFQGAAHSDFLEINGYATASQDRAKIDELWQPIMKNWFTEGREDPRISVIKVTAVDGYYWETKHGFAMTGIKMLIGAVTGKTTDVGHEGKLHV
jgi:general stress protein 26